MLTSSRLPWDVAATDAEGGTASPASDIRPGRYLIAVLLLTAAALDLTRCGLVLMTARDPAPAAGLVAAGPAAAALSVQTARGCQAGRRWAGWAALLIGATSAPQAGASGFHSTAAVRARRCGNCWCEPASAVAIPYPAPQNAPERLREGAAVHEN